MKMIRRVCAICLRSTFVTQFLSFKSHILHNFNPKHALHFIAVAALELTDADMYTDQHARIPCTETESGSEWNAAVQLSVKKSSCKNSASTCGK